MNPHPLDPDTAAWLQRSLQALPPDTCPGVRLWLHDLREAAPPAALGWLSAEEHARAARFAFERDRRRYQASHAGLRQVLAEAAGVAPAVLHFSPGPHGKPRLVGPGASLSFNLSHSADVALIGLASDPSLGELGVDLEVDHAIDDLWGVARAQFTPAEVAELQALPASEVQRHFLIAWTRKEACLKAIGSGFSIPSDGFYGGVMDRPLDTVLPTPEGEVALHVRGVVLGAGQLGAVAWRTPGAPA